jgi:phosphoglycolate phosphatase
LPERVKPAAEGIFMKRHLIVFDLDGTLVDSSEDIADGYNALRASLGLAPLPTATVVAAVGDGLRETVDRVFADASESLRRRAHEDVMTHYARHTVQKTKPYDGVEELLRELHGRCVPMAIVSNKPDSMVRDVVAGLGWEGAFGAVLGGETPVAMKPSPDGIHFVRDKLRLPLDTLIWMVGDSPQDMDAGRAAGGQSLWASWGFHTHAPGSTDITLKHPLEILKLLLKKVPATFS